LPSFLLCLCSVPCVGSPLLFVPLILKSRGILNVPVHLTYWRHIQRTLASTLHQYSTEKRCISFLVRGV
jgi:hypothetical protein